ncbi:MAG: glycolate oxidase binding subunit [Abditibacteriota bacterium]|nr:glycolate oxidase binding subunit [Abditibacteriota bacterium]
MISQLHSEFNNRVELRDAQDGDACDGLTPQAVAAPRDEEAAHELVAWCGRQKVAFIARGGGSRWHIGARPERFDLLISTEHLNHIIEHDEGNATVQAGAGITIEALDAATRQRGQFVPLDRADARATLGGIVATNRFAADKMKYGAPRDLVVGLHAALSDGRLVKAGSKVVKNVSGYDLNKIFTGSFGSLGLLTQVTLRLRAQSEAVHTYYGTFPDTSAGWGDAVNLAQEIHNGLFDPTSLQLFNDVDGIHVQASFEGSPAAIEIQLSRLPESGQPSGALSFDFTSGWQLRAQLPLLAASEWAQMAMAGGAKVLWEVGNGVVRAAFSETTQSTTLLPLREAAHKSDGFVVIERVPAEWKTPELVWGPARADFPLMKRLKSALDAAHICAPGRFIGGI